VPDGADLCPATAAGEPVDADGCSASQRDTDNDGVSDALDLCPDTPAGTTVDADGCPVAADADGDGVADAVDNCPDVPNPDQQDSDGDGVGDACEVSNVPPVANGDAASVPRGEGNSVRINVIGNDTDADGSIDPNSIVIVDQPTQATVSVHNDGSVTVTLTSKSGKNRSFTYTVKDNLGATSNIARVDVAVN
jgi:hypothetical protein